MSTIALIGADGSGKTTIANRLLKEQPIKLKYLYMGLNIESSNHSLFTSKLIYYHKVYKYKKKMGVKGSLKKQNLSLHDLNDERLPDSRGKLAATLRTLNRIAEQSYRQLIAWFYQLRGQVVLFDRHFLFDGAIDEVQSNKLDERLSERIYHWMLTRVFPKPDITIFLYAPAEVLFSRKGEATLEYLDAKNQSMINIGNHVKNFIKIDATQPLEKVYNDVISEVLNFHYGSTRNVAN
jgi:thymidylate kinase